MFWNRLQPILALLVWAKIAVGSTTVGRFGRSDAQSTKVVPSTVALGPSIAQFISSEYGFDGPQMSSIDITAFDWWYFDAVSPDLNTSVVIVFYTALATAFPFLDVGTDVTVVGMQTSWPNGTTGKYSFKATEAIITTNQKGASGDWVGSGASFTGASDLSSYLVSINSSSTGIYGDFLLESVAPAHYPCGPATAGSNLEVGPNIGWSNAMPDAVGTVNFNILGSSLNFTGVAYHDKVSQNSPRFNLCCFMLILFSLELE
jgi:hypothetical protein